MHAGAVHVHPVHGMAAMRGAAEFSAFLRRACISSCDNRDGQSQQHKNKAESLEALGQSHS